MRRPTNKEGWGSQPIGPQRDASWKIHCGVCGKKNIKERGFDKPHSGGRGS